MRTNIHPDEALKLVLEAGASASQGIKLESIPISAGLGRFLTGTIVSAIDHPPFDKSAMDGFAVTGKSGDGVYEVIESVPAGKAPSSHPVPGQAVRIMTGAPLPPGTAFVQRLEWTEKAGSSPLGTPLVRFLRPESADNVIRRGENLSAGSKLLGPGLIGPQEIGILASAGIGKVDVARQARVAVISTGDELRAAGECLDSASIYDSNGPQLTVHCLQAGALPEYLGIARDEAGSLEKVLSRALSGYDLVIVSGAVSLGDFDLVPSTLEALGVTTVFHGVMMRPGKPTYFGTHGKKAVFGLPGNPVSTFVNFEVFVKPYLMARMGLEHSADIIRARLASRMARRGSDRVEYLPAVFQKEAQGMAARPLSYHGSSMLSVLAEADCLVRMEAGIEEIAEGEMVDARRIRT